MKVPIKDLKPSEYSENIYSSEPSQDLIDSIERNGIITPIWISDDNLIISGHRRVNACKSLGMEDVEAETRDYSESLVIESNRYREKTWQEKLKEAEARERILKPKAKKKQSHGQTAPGKTLCQKSDEALDTKKEVAATIGTSHDTLHKAKIIQREKPELLVSVDTGKESINSAYRKIEREKNKDDALKKIASMDLPTDKYQIILADPPWRYEHSVSGSREIENQYPTMSLNEICNLPISDMVAEESLLFLWTTSPKLEESIQVVNAWDYNYRTCMVWVKDKIGMGYYARQQHELLLIAKKGNFPTPKAGTQHSSIIESPRLKHSQKPLEIYDIIESMYPGMKYLELFARQERFGWTSWGNQL